METNREHYAELPLKVALDAYDRAYAACVKATNDPTASIGTFHDWLDRTYSEHDLRPCPFCGEPYPIVVDCSATGEDHDWYVRCPACDSRTDMFREAAQAARMWNGDGCSVLDELYGAPGKPKLVRSTEAVE